MAKADGYLSILCVHAYARVCTEVLHFYFQSSAIPHSGLMPSPSYPFRRPGYLLPAKGLEDTQILLGDTCVLLGDTHIRPSTANRQMHRFL